MDKNNCVPAKTNHRHLRTPFHRLHSLHLDRVECSDRFSATVYPEHVTRAAHKCRRTKAGSYSMYRSLYARTLHCEKFLQLVPFAAAERGILIEPRCMFTSNALGGMRVEVLVSIPYHDSYRVDGLLLSVFLLLCVPDSPQLACDIRQLCCPTRVVFGVAAMLFFNSYSHARPVTVLGSQARNSLGIICSIRTTWSS